MEKEITAKVKRTPIARTTLELAIVDSVRGSDPKCKGLVRVFVERVVPASPGDANWAVKGIVYGKAKRDRCGAILASCVKEGQAEFEISD